MSSYWFSKIKNIIVILLGNTIYTFGVAAFILPNDLITGGTTGLGIAANHYLNLPISTVVFIFNTTMFILGAIILGKHFALTTLISTFYYPFILGVFQGIPALGNITDDRMLSVVCAGLMIGCGIGIVIRAGASTGGVDIPPLILNKKFGLPVSVMLYVFDFVILLLQMLFSNKESIIYGIILVMIYTYVLDKVLMIGHTQIQVKIISKKYEQINDLIVHKLDRGCTLLHGQTGYLHVEQPVILTVISNRELSKLNEMVNGIDPEAFMVISHVNEVKGRGFSLKKTYQKESAQA